MKDRGFYVDDDLELVKTSKKLASSRTFISIKVIHSSPAPAKVSRSSCNTTFSCSLVSVATILSTSVENGSPCVCPTVMSEKQVTGGIEVFYTAPGLMTHTLAKSHDKVLCSFLALNWGGLLSIGRKDELESLAKSFEGLRGNDVNLISMKKIKRELGLHCGGWSAPEKVLR